MILFFFFYVGRLHYFTFVSLVVNFTNILWAAFAPIFLRLNLSTDKLFVWLSYKKSCSKNVGEIDTSIAISHHYFSLWECVLILNQQEPYTAYEGQNFSLAFWLKSGPRDTYKDAMWPADKNSSPLVLNATLDIRSYLIIKIQF